ncbi:MAG: hypothetical protein IH986_13870 [Planctomycetes bacterium]|nr:hypothetical protein [Planctomycetota bacterium]
MACSACLRVGAGVLWAQIAWSALAQSTYYVDGTCGNDAWTGTNSVCVAPNGPQRTIQAGIDARVTGDTVIVADGTYTQFGHRDLDFGGRDLVLGSAAGNPILCVIDCQASQSNPHRGFLFRSGETSATVVDGFTAMGGLQTRGACRVLFPCWYGNP